MNMTILHEYENIAENAVDLIFNNVRIIKLLRKLIQKKRKSRYFKKKILFPKHNKINRFQLIKHELK